MEKIIFGIMVEWPLFYRLRYDIYKKHLLGAPFGTCMANIWNRPDVSVKFDLGTVFGRVRGGVTISKLSIFQNFPNWCSRQEGHEISKFSQIQNSTHYPREGVEGYRKLSKPQLNNTLTSTAVGFDMNMNTTTTTTQPPPPHPGTLLQIKKDNWLV